MTLVDRSAVELLARATRTAGTAAGPAAILAFVDALLPFTSCLVTLLAAGRQPVVLYDDIRPERREAVIEAYLRGAYLLDPFYDLVVRGLDRQIVRLQEIQPDHFRKSEYFSTYYTDTPAGGRGSASSWRARRGVAHLRVAWGAQPALRRSPAAACSVCCRCCR